MSPTDVLLALNCGSSSIKFKLFLLEDLGVLISGSASRVDSKGQRPIIKLTVHHVHGEQDETETEQEEEGMEYNAVFQRTIDLIESSSSKHFEPIGEGVRAHDVIKLVAHRVVHGGSQQTPMAIWPGHEEGLEELDKLSEFAPLHNHRAVQVVKACLKHLPSSRQILLFDTLFHQSIPEHVYTYPLALPPTTPPIPLRKYGAHGLSYASVLSSVSSYLQKPEQEVNIVVAHLGSGASVCAIKNGKSYDTSMGLTPLDGLPGGTRSGSIDPALVFHHTPASSEAVDFKGTRLCRGEMLLNKEAGFAALTGTSDFRTITTRAWPKKNDSVRPEDEYAAKLAYNLFLDRIINYVSSYVVKILGTPSPNSSRPPSLDGIVFSGGIGEKSVELRRDVTAYFKWLGVEIDDEKNASASAGKEGNDDQNVFLISKDDSKFGIFMCLTDEETQCAIMAKEYEARQ